MAKEQKLSAKARDKTAPATSFATNLDDSAYIPAARSSRKFSAKANETAMTTPASPAACSNDEPNKKDATFYRTEGNAAMANHNYKRALVSYQIGLQLLQTHENNSTIDDTSIVNNNKTLGMALHSNLALAHLKLGNFAASVASCVAALQLDPRNAKMWLRLACAKQFMVAELAEQQQEQRDADDKVDETNMADKLQVLLQGAMEHVAKAVQLLELECQSQSSSNMPKGHAALQRECRATQERIQQLAQQMKLSLSEPIVDGDKNHDDDPVPQVYGQSGDSQLPSPDQQRQVIFQLVQARRQSPAQAGEAFYLLDWNWYEHWCRYAQCDVSSLLPEGVAPDLTAPAANGNNKNNGGASTINPPGPIDNSRLLLVSSKAPESQQTFYQQWYRPYYQQEIEANSHGSDNGESMHQCLPLRPNLCRGYDYELLPREVYATLRCWYGEVMITEPITKAHSAAGICRRSEWRDKHTQQELVVRLYATPVMHAAENATAPIVDDTMLCYACRAHVDKGRRCTRCATVQYCSKRCQQSHWQYHRLECIPVDKEAFPSSPPLRALPDGWVGMKNIGNSCYMNAILQCLLHSAPLVRHFLSNTFEKDLNEDNALGAGGDLALSFGRMIRDVCMNPQLRRGGNTCYSPLGLKRSVARKAPRFADSQQHDAQEFLAYLLDGLHEDLNRIKKAPYVEMPDITDGANMAIASAQAWDLHKKRNDSLVFDCFYGQFKNTCVCPKCDRVSVSFESFNHVNLEIPQKKGRPSLYPVFLLSEPPTGTGAFGEKPILFGFDFYRTQSVADLKQALSEATGIPATRIILCEILNKALYNMFQDEDILGTIDSSTVLAAYEADSIDEKDCFHVVAEHILITQLVNGTIHEEREYFGLPFIASFPATLTCREVWENLWRRVACLVPVEAQEILRLRVHTGGVKGQPINVFPLEATSDTGGAVDSPETMVGEGMRTSIMPTYSDQPLRAFLGEDANQRFLHIWLEWTDVGDDNESGVAKIDMDRFHEYETHASYTESVASRKASGSADKGVLLDECFESFQRPERLDDQNKWYCSNCKDHVQALKTMQLWKLPNILIVHMKRFESRHMFRQQKLDTFVDFPINGLDIGKHCASSAHSQFIEQNVPADYDLFGVVNHYGRLGFGHYTAFARQFDEAGLGEWVHCDDSSIEEVDQPESIATSAAYVLFYRRRVFS